MEITREEWRVVTNPPVRFRRTRGMLPLPAPVPGGSVDELRSFVNYGTEDDFRLMVAWASRTRADAADDDSPSHSNGFGRWTDDDLERLEREYEAAP